MNQLNGTTKHKIDKVLMYYHEKTRENEIQLMFKQCCEILKESRIDHLEGLKIYKYVCETLKIENESGFYEKYIIDKKDFLETEISIFMALDEKRKSEGVPHKY